VKEDIWDAILFGVAGVLVMAIFYVVGTGMLHFSEWVK
jgi:hypothetical protein